MNHKRIFFSTILIIFSEIFFSCGLKINVDDEITLLTRPDVKEHDVKGFTVSTKLYTDNTQFINIFRRTITNIDSNNPKYSEPILIGTLFPENMNSSNKTYTFDDVAIVNSVNYQYKMSYYDSKNKEFSYSAWSEKISLPDESAKGQDTSLVSLKYEFDSNAFFVYNDESKSLLLMKTNENSESENNSGSGENTGSDNEDSEPASGENNSIIQNENELGGGESGTNENSGSGSGGGSESSGSTEPSSDTNPNALITAVPENLYGIEAVPALIFKKEGTSEMIAVKLSETDKTFLNEIHLISYLPDSWWKTQLIFCGVAGYQEKRIDDKIQYIHWTEPNTSLKIKKAVTGETGTTYTDEPTFSVDTSASGTSFDFTLPK